MIERINCRHVTLGHMTLGHMTFGQTFAKLNDKLLLSRKDRERGSEKESDKHGE